jgi:hypothetical protein
MHLGSASGQGREQQNAVGQALGAGQLDLAFDVTDGFQNELAHLDVLCPRVELRSPAL